MSDLICRKTMRACLTPGMCSPFGGCRETEPVRAALAQGEARRDREADRARFPDPAFNRWLDEGISDAGHTVWDAVGDVQAAWSGWENRPYYAAPPPPAAPCPHIRSSGMTHWCSLNGPAAPVVTEARISAAHALLKTAMTPGPWPTRAEVRAALTAALGVK